MSESGTPHGSRRRWLATAALGALVLSSAGALTVTPSSAQEAAPAAAEARVAPSETLRHARVSVVNAFARAELPAPRHPADLAARIPDAAAHAVAKRAAEAAPATRKPVTRSSPAAPAAPTSVRSFEGINQNESSGFRPPDNDGAQGAGQYVQIVNSAIRVFNTNVNPPSVVSTRSLNSFMGYTATSVFDPRVLFDPVYQRWIVVAEAFPESASVQFAFVAVSRTSNAAGAYFVYRFDRGGSAATESFFDYPQLGQDQDAVLVTGTQFPNNGAAARAEFFCLSKARLYNGLNVGSPVFGNLEPTLAPPNVLDSSATAVLMAAPNNSGELHTYKATGCGRTPTTLTKPTPIAVPGGYTVPPSAEQPGTTSLLDTLDNRFQNRSTQYGNSLWNVHTKAISGFAVPQWYEVDVSGNVVRQQGVFFASGTSDDFNPSLAARPNGTVVFGFSSTDRPAGIHAQVRFTSRTAATALGATDSNAGIAVFTSPTFYDPTTATVDRWGDYSSVSLDQASSTRAYLVVEKVNSAGVWGSRIAQVGG